MDHAQSIGADRAVVIAVLLRVVLLFVPNGYSSKLNDYWSGEC